MLDADRRRIAADAAAYGPATCGCVAPLHYDLRILRVPGYDKMRGIVREELKGWPFCPHCGGTGVDKRVA